MLSSPSSGGPLPICRRARRYAESDFTTVTNCIANKISAPPNVPGLMTKQAIAPDFAIARPFEQRMNPRSRRQAPLPVLPLPHPQLAQEGHHRTPVGEGALEKGAAPGFDFRTFAEGQSAGLQVIKMSN